MSKVLLSATQKSTTAKTAGGGKMVMMPSNNSNNKPLAKNAAVSAIGQQHLLPDGTISDAAGDVSPSIDFDDFTTSSSILEFLSKEQECWRDEDADAESIFQEVSRLADNSDTRSVDEILREAELLIQQQQTLAGDEVSGLKQKKNAIKTLNGGGIEKSTTLMKNTIKMNSKYTKKIENVRSAVSANIFEKRRSSTPSSASLLLKSAGSVANVSVSASSPTAVISSVSRSQSQQSFAALTPPSSAASTATGGGHFSAFVDNMPTESVLSEESTPKDLQTLTTGTETQFQNGSVVAVNGADDTDDGTDTMEEITEGIETIELLVNEEGSNSYCMAAMTTSANNFDGSNFNQNETTRAAHTKLGLMNGVANKQYQHHQQQSFHCESSSPLQHLTSPVRRPALNFNATQACSPLPQEELEQQQKQQRRNSASTVRRSSMQTPDSGIGSHATVATQTPQAANAANNDALAAVKTFSNKSSNSSPKHFVSSVTSPIESFAAITREHALKQEIELLQEKLKDTEERLQSLQIRHESLSQLHRDLRESNTHLQEETEMLKLDVQHLNECANVLRSELKASRQDRTEALELQKVLQTELEESRQEKKQTLQQKEKDTKTIQDLQRQCREMERILMRKHPDSVSALIVASKNPGKMGNNDQENVNSRKLLEQRIAQLESDAKEQDKKAQQILANVQARFNSVQSKYETHIADLETQVLSLQEINTKLNEKIESQVRTLDYFVTKKAEKFYNNCTQTEPTHDELQMVTVAENRSTHFANANPNSSTATQTAKASTRDHSTNTIASNSHPPSASSSTSSTANSTPNNSRPNSKQSGLRKPTASASSLSSALASKLPVSQSDSTISLTSYHHSTTSVKEDAHLLATIRGMRVDLAIKDKALQRLSRELDDCKKTIKKLQKDASKPHNATNSASTSRRTYDAAHYTAASDHQSSTTMPANTETQALKEAQSKIKLLEADYKSLHDKRLQDLKTLQSAHERELSSCHETVRILQQRLNERDEAFAMQKRRKVPVDYYALKAKVSSLERRHSEREERLHMLVEALSKGRLNGALDDLLGDNNNQ